MKTAWISLINMRRRIFFLLLFFFFFYKTTFYNELRRFLEYLHYDARCKFSRWHVGKQLLQKTRDGDGVAIRDYFRLAFTSFRTSLGAQPFAFKSVFLTRWSSCKSNSFWYRRFCTGTHFERTVKKQLEYRKQISAKYIIVLRQNI